MVPQPMGLAGVHPQGAYPLVHPAGHGSAAVGAYGGYGQPGGGYPIQPGMVLHPGMQQGGYGAQQAGMYPSPMAQQMGQMGMQPGTEQGGYGMQHAYGAAPQRRDVMIPPHQRGTAAARRRPLLS